MRLLLAPNRKKFFRHPLNIIDMVSVVPIYITLFFDLVVGSESELGDLGRLIQVLIHPSSECEGVLCWCPTQCLSPSGIPFDEDLPGVKVGPTLHRPAVVRGYFAGESALSWFMVASIFDLLVLHKK